MTGAGPEDLRVQPDDLRVQGYGDDAILVDLPDLEAVRALDDALRADVPPGAVDLVPAARTELVRFAPGTDVAALVAHVRRAWAHAAASATGPASTPSSARAVGVHHARTPAEPTPEPELVEIGVHYDGEDLSTVASASGLTRAAVVARHTAALYTVAFGGFMPGFAYLTGVDPVLHVPRRDSPRARVPAGSVALAGGFTAVYPAATPGGWMLIGHSDVVLFDPARGRPALLAPGVRVRFVDLDGRPATDGGAS